VNTPIMQHWNKIGDFAHLAIIINAVAFASAVVFWTGDRNSQAHHSSKIFDSDWESEGFCVSNKHVHYWNSHDLCLYFDIIGSIAVGSLYYFLKDVEGMGPANALVWNNIAGILMHGIGHGFVAKGIRQDEDHNQEPDSSNVGSITFNMIFWFVMLRACLTNGSTKINVPLTIPITLVHTMYLPLQFRFTYVQTILFLTFSLNEMLKPVHEKNMEYALFPLIVGLPLLLVGWIESTQCSNFVMSMGGHLIYDAYISVSVICFHLVCWGINRSSKPKIKKV